MTQSTQDTPYAAARHLGDLAWVPSLVRGVALIGLFLLPIQMRAGAQAPHPHALLHLLLDASDGSFDHHTLDETASTVSHDHVGAVTAADSHEPDVPDVGTSVSAAGGLAILAAIVTALTIPPRLAERSWLHPAHRRSRFLALEPPPPRIASV